MNKDKLIVNKKIKFESSLIYNIIKKLDRNQFKLYEDIVHSDNFDVFFKDEQIVSTALAFFDYNLNISETSKHIFMHRNTLIYRLDKIHKLTGLDIRQFDDAVTMQILLIIKYYKVNQ